jgi:peptide/nickel transport system permease protein
MLKSVRNGKKFENKNIRRLWYKFSRNPLSVLGLIIIILIVLIAIFAPIVSPYPEAAGDYIDFSKSSKSPSIQHWFGTDTVGRDILTRIFFGFRISLKLSMLIMTISLPIGTLVGLVSGYYCNTWVDTLLMRSTDIFMALPPLVMALSVASVLTPGIISATLAISLNWWTIYARLMYSITTSLRNEAFVLSAEVIGVNKLKIMLKEILPNCLGPLLTKVSLDMGWVILLGASLSFVGLGAQPPTPDLGTMVSEGSKFLPDQWWMCIFPALFIMIIVLGFNLLGDGIRDMLGSSERS